MEMKYSLIYANRKTVSIKIETDGTITVRAPRFTSRKEIERIIKAHEAKLLQMREKVLAKENIISSADRAELEKKLRKTVMPLVERYSKKMGKSAQKVRFTDAKTRFGSCSSKGSVCFSRYLALYPDAAIEYVVVHELAHLFEMNHSSSFYAIVEKYLPDWRERKKLLKLDGNDN